MDRRSFLGALAAVGILPNHILERVEAEPLKPNVPPPAPLPDASRMGGANARINHINVVVEAWEIRVPPRRMDPIHGIPIFEPAPSIYFRTTDPSAASALMGSLNAGDVVDLQIYDGRGGWIRGDAVATEVSWGMAYAGPGPVMECEMRPVGELTRGIG